VGTKQTFEKAARKTGTTATKAAMFDHKLREQTTTWCALVFIFCNICTQTGYYKKEIYRLVANLCSCNTTHYY